MKDDTSTPIADDSPNEFERGKAETADRSRAEAAIEGLRQKGGVFVDAVRATRMPMVLTGPRLPGNPIVFANDAFLRLSGYRMEEVLGQQPHFMNGPDTDPRDAARFREMVRADQDEVLETVQYRKNGSRFVATVLISGFKDDTGRTLHHFMSWLDVTRRVDAEEEVSELRRTQKALQISEAKYRGLLNSIDEGFCIIEVIFDGAGRAVDYVFLETNSAFERQTGIKGAVGRRMRDIAPDHEQHWFETYGRIALTGEPKRFEQPAGALGRYYDVYAFRVGASFQNQVGILFNDIGERKRAESATREREEQQAFLLALEDRLRHLAQASEIMCTATRSLGMHLKVDRCMYAEVEGDRGAELGTIRGQYVRSVGADEKAITVFPPHFTYETYGENIMEARYRGDGLAVSDIAVEPGFSSAERSAWLDAEVAAAVVAPLVKDGRLVAELGIHSRTPRPWTETEIALIRDVAERTWAAAERARAETALRASEEKYRALFESMDEAYAVVEVLKDEAGNWVDFRFVDANPAFVEHTSMPYPVGKTATELLGTPNPRWTELYGQALDSGKPIRTEEGEPTLGLTFDLNIFSLDRERNRVAALFTNITERKRSDEALRESERLRTAMLDVLPLGLALVDRDGKEILGNREWARFIPNRVIPSVDPDRGSRWRSWDEDGRPIAPSEFPGARALRGESVVPPMEFLYDDDGREMWTSVAAVPVRGADGEVVGAVDVIQDIDAAKRATEALRDSERHAQLLLAELQHRVRNTLAVVRSIARRTADGSSTIEEMVSHFEGRLNAFSRVQSAVTRNPHNGISLETIIEDELVSVAAREGEQYRLKGPEICFRSRAAESISLAVHELATNAVKYGALAGGTGSIRVNWEVRPSGGEAKTLFFEWVERGLVQVPNPTHEGFGHEMLRRTLPYDLGADTEIQFNEDGIRFEMSLPLTAEILVGDNE